MTLIPHVMRLSETRQQINSNIFLYENTKPCYNISYSNSLYLTMDFSLKKSSYNYFIDYEIYYKLTISHFRCKTIRVRGITHDYYVVSMGG